MGRAVLAIDEGSTGVRALVFDRESRCLAAAYEEIRTAFPRPGWVEQDPEAIWAAALRVTRAALEQAGLAPGDVAAVGVTNQRATTVVWDAESGGAVHPAIGWQDVRTAARVPELLELGIFANTMASVSKLEWIVRNVPEAARTAGRGRLRFGTVDSWLVWKLTGGRTHITDHSNASCTGLYDFSSGAWDLSAAARLGLPESLFPALSASSAVCGTTDFGIFGAEVPVAGLAGDQQAAMFGELCLQRGEVKVTFGTSGMLDVHTGDVPVLSERGVYPLVLWSLAGTRPYCAEATVITAGAAVQWLRDGLGILSSLDESERLANSVQDSGGVWAVPAFQGLGSPYMRPAARAVIGGLSRGSTRAHIVRAVLEGIAFRTREALAALVQDSGTPMPQVLRVDGGAAANEFLLQTVADTIGCTVERPETVQASALGAAYLAGLAVEFWTGLEELRRHWRSGGRFEPRTGEAEREDRYRWWRRAVERTEEEG